MTGDAELVFSVVEADPDWAWPPMGALGTGNRPAAVPVDHGRSVVLTGVTTTAEASTPSVSLLGRAVRAREVSASRR